MALELDVYRGQLEQARHLTNLTDDDKRKKAVRACAEKDFEVLWEIVLGYLTLYAQNKILTSTHTIRSYHTGIRQFVEYATQNAWNLLNPKRDDPQLWVNALLVTPAINPKAVRPPRKPKTLSIDTVRSRVAAVRTLYRALRWTGATEADPFQDVRMPKDNTHSLEKNAPYAEEEVEAFLEHADLPMRVLIYLLSHGGLRISEALAVEWEDLDDSRRRLRINEGKGRKTRTIAMSSSLLQVLREYRRELGGRPEGQLFSFGTRETAHYHIEKVALQAGVRFRGFHAFRKYAGTRLMEQVKDLSRVANHLGHASVDTTRKYAKPAADDLKDELSGW